MPQARVWVLDASPIIVLGKIGRIDLIGAVFGSFVIPDVVATEVGRGGSIRDLASEWIASEGGARVVPTAQMAETIAGSRSLDPGEAAVISGALALRPGAACVIDDRKARRAAESFGLVCIGTLDVLGAAARIGLVTDLTKLRSDLEKARFRVSDELWDRLVAG